VGDEIADLARVTFGTDGRGIGRAGAHRAVGSGGEDGSVFGALFAEIPTCERIVFERDRAVFAANLDAARPTRISRCAGLNRAQRTARVAQRGDGGILALDTGMDAAGGAPDDFVGHASEPLKQVDAVNRLVHGGTAAVELARAFPAAIIGGLAKPFHVGTGEGDPAEATGVERGFDVLGVLAKAGLKNGRNDDRCGARGGEELVDARGGDFERFFDDEVLACSDCREGGLKVRTAWRGDAHHIDFGMGEQRGEVGCGDRGVNGGGLGGKKGEGLGGELLSSLGIATGDADEPCTCGRGNGARVIVGNHPAANDSKTERAIGGGWGGVGWRRGMGLAGHFGAGAKRNVGPRQRRSVRTLWHLTSKLDFCRNSLSKSSFVNHNGSEVGFYLIFSLTYKRMKKIKRFSLVILFSLVSVGFTHAKSEEGSDDNRVVFYFVRHGKTILNTLGRMQGWADAPLTPEGKSIVDQLGRGMKREGIVFKSVYSSDSARAKTTASIILEQNGLHLDINETLALREVALGSYEGELGDKMLREVALYMGYKSGEELLESEKTGIEVVIQALAAIKDLDTLGIAEDYYDLKARAEGFIREVAVKEAEEGGGNLLVVSHGFTIGILLSELDDEEDYPMAIDMGNASVSKVVYKDGKFIIESIGSMYYIEKGGEVVPKAVR